MVLSRGMKGEALSAAMVTMVRTTSANNCHDPASSLGEMRTGPFHFRCQISLCHLGGMPTLCQLDSLQWAHFCFPRSLLKQHLSSPPQIVNLDKRTTKLSTL
jgi:hypothetical protein